MKQFGQSGADPDGLQALAHVVEALAGEATDAPVQQALASDTWTDRTRICS